jgi:RNA polymerase sigma-70 factor (TIGR02960 family)
VTDLIARAHSGDDLAFAQLVDPHRRELQVHCYRMLGSLQDAEDALQETLLAAWQAFGEFEGRASVRTWLYKIATNRCLNALRSAGRRPRVSEPDTPEGWVRVPEPTRLGEVTWLQPYPDLMLEDIADAAPGPEARIEAREAISIGFVTALQLLPPLQRTVLVLRDVLGFRAGEVAKMLDTTEESVTSALKRARSGLSSHQTGGGAHEPPAAPGSPEERELIDRLSVAWESGDMETILAALTDDVWLKMPPLPLEYQGRELATRFFEAVVFRPGHHRFKMVPTRANGQPALAFYFVDPVTGLARVAGLLVLTLAGTRVSAITRFDSGVLDRFGLPRTLPA